METPYNQSGAGSVKEQQCLYGKTTEIAIVNVASVPMRSPFRYPGGKTWLVPRVRQWLRSQPEHPCELIEPFAGGGIVSLTAVFEKLVDRATMVELDFDVASVWHTILNGRAQWLAQQMVNFKLSHEAVTAVLSGTPRALHERAFATMLRNRISRGGIMAPGAGVVKKGENGRGLASRWYPKTLRRRILDIVALKERIRFIQGDGIGFMKANADRRDAVFFIDPPYVVAGRRLYTHSEIDHAELFRTAEALAGDFLITYDNAPEIRQLAERHGFAIREVPMKSTHHERKTELLISRNLDWPRG
jgi:DNA adenine methylase